MQPGIQQTTIVTQGGDTQPTPSIRRPPSDSAPAVDTASTFDAAVSSTTNKAVPFWRGVIVAAIAVLIITAALAGILLILPATH